MTQKKLRTQFITISLMLLTATLLVYAMVIFIANDSIEKDMRTHNESMVKIVTEQIHNTIDIPIQLLGNVDHMIMNNSTESETVREYLETVQKTYPYFERIYIIDLDGYIANTAPYDPSLLGDSVRFEPFFQTYELGENEYHWSEIYISRKTNNPTISVTYGDDSYFIVADMNLELLPITLSSEEYYDEIYNISILDQWGTYIIANDIKYVEERRRYKNFDDLKLLTDDRLWHEDNKISIRMFELEELNWYVVFEVDTSNMYKDLNMLIIITFSLLMLIILIIGLILKKYLGDIDRDIQNLKKKTHSIVENSYSITETRPFKYEEISDFNEDFDNMLNIVKEREAEIKKVNEHLEELVRERTKNLEEINGILVEEIKEKNKAEDANEAKSRFLSIMSHEMRTPLNGIRGFIQMLKKTKLDSEQQELMTVIQNSSDILLELINDLLDVEKYASGKMTFLDEHHMFDSSIKKILRPYKNLAAMKGLDYRVEMGSDLSYDVLVDYRKIEQLFNNLLSNAIKFSNEGDIVVSIDTKREEDLLRFDFSVEDCGIGILEEVKQRLFRPFSQANAEISKEFGGTGLGLAICMEIVKHYNGNIDFYSEVGKGAMFYGNMYFEIGEGSSEDFSNQLKTEGKIDALSLEGKIVVAEDNQVNQKLMKKFLAGYKIDVIIANNGQEAVDICDKENVSLIFMDWQMPIMNGIEATKLIKSKYADNITIVAMTAFASKEEQEECFKAGMDFFLSKPVDLSELEHMLNLASRKASMSDEVLVEHSIVEDEIQKLISIIGFDYETTSDLIYTFIDQLGRGIKEIRTLMDEKDVDGIMRKAHQLKGAAAAVRIERIRKPIEEIERYMKNEDYDAIVLLIDQMEQDLLLSGKELL